MVLPGNRGCSQRFAFGAISMGEHDDNPSELGGNVAANPIFRLAQIDFGLDF